MKCAFCGRPCDEQRILLKIWTSQGKVAVTFCTKECTVAGASYLDEKVNEVTAWR